MTKYKAGFVCVPYRVTDLRTGETVVRYATVNRGRTKRKLWGLFWIAVP